MSYILIHNISDETVIDKTVEIKEYSENNNHCMI